MFLYDSCDSELASDRVRKISIPVVLQWTEVEFLDHASQSMSLGLQNGRCSRLVLIFSMRVHTWVAWSIRVEVKVYTQIDDEAILWRGDVNPLVINVHLQSTFIARLQYSQHSKGCMTMLTEESSLEFGNGVLWLRRWASNLWCLASSGGGQAIRGAWQDSQWN